MRLYSVVRRRGRPPASMSPNVPDDATDSATPERRQHAECAGEPLDAGARTSEHGGQAQSAYRATAFFGGVAVRAADRGGAGLLDSEARVYAAAVDRPGGHRVSYLRHYFRDRGHSGNPEDRECPGMRTVC